MKIRRLNAKVLDQCAQFIIGHTGINFFRDTERIENGSARRGGFMLFNVGDEESSIERRIVRHEYFITTEFGKGIEDIRDEWLALKHLVRDSVHSAGRLGHRNAGINKRRKDRLGNTLFIEEHGADFGDLIDSGECSCGLKVKSNEAHFGFLAGRCRDVKTGRLMKRSFMLNSRLPLRLLGIILFRLLRKLSFFSLLDREKPQGLRVIRQAVDRTEFAEVLAFVDSQTVLEVALENKIRIATSCGGMGTCGTCRVEVLESPPGFEDRNEIECEMAKERGFTPRERLACQMKIQPGLFVRIPETSIED